MTASISSETNNKLESLDSSKATIPTLPTDDEALERRRKLERQLVRKLDLRMSMLVVIFILNFIDRSNAAVARLRGFEEDLGLSGNQYPTVLSIFFVGYILMMVPSNLYLNYIKRPSLYLPACTIVWGLISVATGFTQNFGGVLACRFFLGFVESSFFPGALFTLSAWYKQEELGLRNCILFCGILISTAFGTLMATGILDAMEGKLGYAAWRWLFFIEGAITVALAIPAMFILPDFPSNASNWLSPEEVALAQLRKKEDMTHDEEDKVSAKEGLIMSIKDPKTWWLAFCMAGFQLSIGFHQFFPTLTATLGYNRTISLLLCTPPSLVGAISAFIISRHSDKVKQRFSHFAFSVSLGIIGFVMSLTTMNIGVRYTAIFFMDLTPAAFVVLLAWISNSFPKPANKRATSIGIATAFSQLGSIAGSYVFPSSWGPRYTNSYIISIVVSCVTIGLAYGYKRYLDSLNRKTDEDEQKIGALKGFRYIV
ncbi:hypothetical protein AX16_000877 [Volvariella volvacea WC 439]|nr:hypothetical protein AX16_000877 [Volvariella volvacea WC 439]